MPWDLVIFDEAHRLRNVYKETGSARAKQLKEALARHFKILLTATPLQNSLMELYGLVGVIDDGYFGDETTFRNMYAGARADRIALGSLRQRLQPIYKRHLRRDVQEAGHVSFTKRIAVTFDFEPGDREAQLYEAVSGYLQRPDTYGFGLNPNQLVIMQARKILGSSVAAIEQFLANVIARLEKSLPADLAAVSDDRDPDDIREEARKADGAGAAEDVANGEVPIDPVKLKAEITELSGYKQLPAEIGKNAKGEKLIARLPEVLHEVVARGGKRKAVIFTESVRTQKYLARLLSENGYDGQTVLLNGSNSDPESGALYRAWLARHIPSRRHEAARLRRLQALLLSLPEVPVERGARVRGQPHPTRPDPDRHRRGQGRPWTGHRQAQEVRASNARRISSRGYRLAPRTPAHRCGEHPCRRSPSRRSRRMKASSGCASGAAGIVLDLGHRPSLAVHLQIVGIGAPRDAPPHRDRIEVDPSGFETIKAER